ncbi:unnamed protein product (macronuclear) [Paramecium tetraurelia]|uniref:FCP1 homology domain-containing protein n=1 Tax=Paramecium tetraurelia TaxID=5888 RepID=A0DA81_PARTE|nr:uncharacterized protein GSPATT00014855001 [Paramecium tetraurelia]CAK79948.1 unnamed protein product [Paramecium tetraurelia]|eukprot:XP_001447345.1 hypothetical protein (macronuclear) [Paramecium tetraurelia strain d4-2]
MLRRNSSTRETSLINSLEQKSFLNLAGKLNGSEFPAKTTFGLKNKENKENTTARMFSLTPTQENLFSRPAIKNDTNNQNNSKKESTSKNYMYLNMEEQNQRVFTKSTQLFSKTPIYNQSIPTERFESAQTVTSSLNFTKKPLFNSSNELPGISIQSVKELEFNSCKKQQSSIPTSYLDNAITQRNNKTQDQKENTTTRVSIDHNTSNLPKIYYISSIIKAFKQKGSNSAKEHLIHNMQGIIIGKKVKVTPVKQSIILPTVNKKTLLFDLDETLVHCNSSISVPGDILLNINHDGETMEASLNVRPYTSHLLQQLSRHFELIIFTASQSYYANAVIDYLDPDKKLISHRFYREHCIPTEDGHFIKDLRIFKTRKLSDMLLIDNAPHSYLYQIQNGVPIIPYIDNKQDEELKSLLQYLMQFKNVKDVREFNMQYLKIPRFSEYDDPQKLLKCEFADYLEQAVI